MVSLHLDTARTWRGGQQQVLLTVQGLRQRGQRAALAARPDGALYRRAAEAAAGRTGGPGAADGPPGGAGGPAGPGGLAGPDGPVGTGGPGGPGGRPAGAGPADPDLLPLAPRTEMDLHAAWRLVHRLRDLRPDLLHAHDAHAVAIAALARSLAGRGAAWPIVASRRVDFRLRRNAFSKWKYRQVDRVICASAAIRRLLAADGVPLDRTTVIHEGVDLARIDRALPLDLHRTFHLPLGCPVAGNVAALVPHKGQQYLVDAVARLVRDVPDIRVLIVGAGELESALARQIRRLHLEAHVILTGFRSDVPSLLKALDLFVMSSVTEGLGTSVLDAMAAGRPVVATRAGGLPESVVDGETGLLVPPRDSRALAAAMAALLRDAPRRRAFGAAGRDRARRDFSADRMVDRTAAVYAEAAAGTSRAADSPRPRAAP